MSKGKFNTAFPLVNNDGRASQNFRDYLTVLDAVFAALLPTYSPVLINAANDAAAATAGVAIGQLYRNGSVVMQRQV